MCTYIRVHMYPHLYVRADAYVPMCLTTREAQGDRMEANTLQLFRCAGPDETPALRLAAALPAEGLDGGRRETKPRFVRWVVARWGCDGPKQPNRFFGGGYRKSTESVRILWCFGSCGNSPKFMKNHTIMQRLRDFQRFPDMFHNFPLRCGNSSNFGIR